MADTLSELPREFRIDEETEKSGHNVFISYGQVDDSNDVYWSGTMTSKYGDLVMFSFELDENFPHSAPKVKFSDEHLKADLSNQDENMQKYIKKMLSITKSGYVDEGKFKWDRTKYLYTYFGSIRDYIMS